MNRIIMLFILGIAVVTFLLFGGLIMFAGIYGVINDFDPIANALANIVNGLAFFGISAFFGSLFYDYFMD